jgi:hypothetical protein
MKPLGGLGRAFEEFTAEYVLPRGTCAEHAEILWGNVNLVQCSKGLFAYFATVWMWLGSKLL